MFALLCGVATLLNITPSYASLFRLRNDALRGPQASILSSKEPSVWRSSISNITKHDNVELDAPVDAGVAQALLEDMLLARIFEDKIAEYYFKGKVTGFVHLYNGQEAVSSGVILALRKDDYVVSTYRDHVHALSKGVPAREVMAELYGKEGGCSRGRGGSMHMFSREHRVVGGFAFIGEQVPVALGTAYAAAYRRSLATRAAVSGASEKHDQVTACFMGDGSTNIGQFYESLNIASLLKLPVIFVVENNNWAIGMAHYRSTSATEIYQKGLAFNIPSVQVDGMNVLAVRAAALKAVERARAGLGPTLIEALTYRIRGHSVADPDELRPAIERSTLGARDPIEHFISNVMKPLRYTTDNLVQLTRKKVQAVVADALSFAESSPHPCVKDAADGIFSPKYEIPFGGKDVCTNSEMSQYAEALRQELRIKGLSRAEKKKLTPIYEQTSPLKVID